MGLWRSQAGGHTRRVCDRARQTPSTGILSIRPLWAVREHAHSNGWRSLRHSLHACAKQDENALHMEETTIDSELRGMHFG